MSGIHSRWSRRAAVLLATCAIPGFAYAADASGDAGAAPTTTNIDEVVVTARKRSETVHDAPLTIAVVGAEKLQALAVTSPNELNGAVPGLTMMTGVGGLPGVTFRGLGSNSSLFSVEASVALFVDGVYSAHTRDYVTPMYDLDHIEMVKGTQGTLLGKNTSLGAISMITRKPAPDLGFGVQTSYDFTTKTPRVEAFANMPVNDQLTIRIAGLFIDDGGSVKNAYDGREPHTRDESGRLSALWRPTDKFDLLFSFQSDGHHQTGQNLEVLRDATAGSTLAARAAAIGQTDFEANPDRHNESDSRAFGVAPAGQRPFDNQTSNRANLVANLQLGGLTFTSQTAYVKWSVSRLTDFDFLNANLLNLADIEKNQQFSQEFRVVSPQDQTFTYLAGVFYFKNDWVLNRTLYGFAPIPLTGSETTFYTQKATAVSAFAQGTFNFTDHFNATVGVRYTDEKKDGSFLRLAGSGVLGASFPAIPQTTLEKHSRTVDGDIGLQYKFDSSKMVYFSLSKGSKGGGFQNAPTTLAGAPYDGETAYTAEVGGKFLFDGASVDVAVFDTWVKGFQFTHANNVGVPPVSQIVVDNSDVRSIGIEVNGSWRPFDGMRLSGGVVYADTVATAVSPAPPQPAVQVEGLVQPRAPRWSGTLDATYTHPLTSDLVLTIAGNLEFASKTYLQPNIGSTLNAPFRGDYAKFNLRVAFGNPDKGWEVAVLGKNLTDVREPLFATAVSATGIAGTNTSAYYGIVMPPREFVLQFNYHW